MVLRQRLATLNKRNALLLAQDVNEDEEKGPGAVLQDLSEEIPDTDHRYVFMT